MRFRPTHLSLLLAAALLPACARVPRDAGFTDVQATIAARTNREIHWIRGDEDDRRVADRLRAILEADPLELDEAVQIALLNNRDLQATYEDLMIAQADLVAAGLLSNPVLDAEVRFAESGGTGVELTAAQSFLEIFQIPLRKKIAASRFEAAKLHVASRVLDRADRVQKAWYDLVAARQLLELCQTAAAAADASLLLAQRLHDAGNITDLDLHLQQAEYEQARLDLAAAEYDVAARRESLNAHMGLFGPAAAAWTAPLHLPDPPADPPDAADLESQIIAANLDLDAMRRQIESAGQTLGLRRTFGLVPDLELGATGEREPDGEWAVGPVVSLPIPLFDQGQPAAAAAAAQLRRTQAEYYAAAVRLRAAARTAWALAQNARGRALHQRDVVLPLRDRITKETQLQFNAMQIGAFELLHARAQQIEAAARYVESLREYWNAYATLETLRSGGTPDLPEIDTERAGTVLDRGIETGTED